MPVRPIVVLVFVVSALAFAGDVVLCDDFDDGVIDPTWEVFGNNLAVISPVEQNGRLEFPAMAGGDDDFGGVVSLWTLDAFQDFQVSVDYTVMMPSGGEVGLSFAVIFSGDLGKGEIIDGFVLDVSHEPEGPFNCVAQFLGGLEFFTCDVSPGAGTTMYMWYDAAADRLWGSYIGFDDPTANSGIQLRESSGADRVTIALVGFVAQNAPAVAGDELFYDDFCVVSGNVIPPGVAGDINGDGAVDVLDLLAVLGAWGSCPGCPADLNGDDVVDILDLLILLGNWS